MPSGEDIASHIYIVGFYSVYKSAKSLALDLFMYRRDSKEPGLGGGRRTGERLERFEQNFNYYPLQKQLPRLLRW